MISNLDMLIAQYAQKTGQRLTGRDLAEQTGVNESTISRWRQMRPIDRIDSDVVLALTEFFNCGIEDLIHIRRDVPDHS